MNVRTYTTLAGRDRTGYRCRGRYSSDISLALWRGLKKLLRRSLDRSSAGALEAANPSNSGTPPMRILGSVAVPAVLLEDDSLCFNLNVPCFTIGLLQVGSRCVTRRRLLEFGLKKTL